MRFSLQDAKKTITRRSGSLALSLHFLRSDELGTEIARLIAYYEELLEQPRRMFSTDEARAIVGDYRLADCLVATLSRWYLWLLPDWQRMLADLPEAAHLFLEEDGIMSPVQLRLALFTSVNQEHSGFLSALQRTEVLRAFGDRYLLPTDLLEYLLVLDAEEESLLTRTSDCPPTVPEVVAQYNQLAFEAALFAASEVHFVIDCAAFNSATDTIIGDRVLGAPGLGSVIKRLCFLARKLGVYYDLSYEQTLQPTAPLLHLTLYGPQEVTGSPQQYGLRLARLCRLLLDYGITERATGRKGSRRLTARAILEAGATVHFLHRTYQFTIDADVLDLLPSPSSESVPSSPDVDLFDSSIEQLFAEAFLALESSNAVEGWRLEREPEPLLLDRGIFIPDFALTRGSRRVYIEILGFWTPSYRERKVQRLQQLKGRYDLLLALPGEAREAFAPILKDFPAVFYKDQLSPTDLLQVMRIHYDNFSERLADLDPVAIQARIERQGVISEREAYSLFNCYRRSEIQEVAKRVTNEKIAFATGLGFYAVDWLKQLAISFVKELDGSQPFSLVDVSSRLRLASAELSQCDDTTLESLLGLLPGLEVRRLSIFEAEVKVNSSGDQATQKDKEQLVQEVVGPEPAKRSAARTDGRSSAKRAREQPSVTQSDLWE